MSEEELRIRLEKSEAKRTVLREELQSLAEDFAPTYGDDNICESCEGQRGARGTARLGACHECMLRERVAAALATDAE